MTKPSVVVKVKFWWNDGTSRAIPIGGVYSSVGKVPGDNHPWPETAWSLVVNFPSGYSGVDKAVGEAHFLVETAPSHLLTVGTIISLYEGKKLAAFVEVTNGIDGKV